MIATLATLATLVAPLADATPAATPDPSVPDFVTTGSWVPGLMTLAAFVFLAIAIIVLVRSMNTRLKKVDFPEPPRPSRPARSPGTEPGPPAD